MGARVKEGEGGVRFSGGCVFAQEALERAAASATEAEVEAAREAAEDAAHQLHVTVEGARAALVLPPARQQVCVRCCAPSTVCLLQYTCQEQSLHLASPSPMPQP